MIQRTGQRIAHIASKLGMQLDSARLAVWRFARQAAPTAGSFVVAVALVSPAPALFKMTLTVTAALMGFATLGLLLAANLKMRASARSRFSWSFSLASVGLGIIFAWLISNGDTYVGYAVVGILAYAAILVPITLGRLTYSSIDVRQYLASRVRVNAQEVTDEIERLDKGAPASKIGWFMMFSAMAAALTVAMGIILGLLLLFPPVAAALALLYAGWLVVRLAHLDGLVRAMAWFRSFDALLMTPFLTLAAQGRTNLFLIVFATLLTLAWGPGILLFAFTHPEQVGPFSADRIAVFALLTLAIGGWFSAQTHTVVALYRRLRFAFSPGPAPPGSPIPAATFGFALTGGPAMAGVIAAAKYLPAGSALYWLVTALAGALCVAGVASWTVQLRTRPGIFPDVDENTDRRIWAIAYLAFLLPFIALSLVWGIFVPTIIGLSLPFLVAAAKDGDLLMKRIAPKERRVGNYALHHAVALPAEVAFLIMVAFFFQLVGLSMQGYVLVTIGGMILATGRVVMFTMDTKKGWAGREPASAWATMVRLVTDNEVESILNKWLSAAFSWTRPATRVLLRPTRLFRIKEPMRDE